MGIDLSREAAPGATTLLRFRSSLETNGVTRSIFEMINAHLSEKGFLMRDGTIDDATVIATPPSTKNRGKKRDPEMRQTRSAIHGISAWAHIDADADSGLVHAMVATSAQVGDVTQAHALPHGEESVASDDTGYQGVRMRRENCDTVRWHVTMNRNQRKAVPTARSDAEPERLERSKAGVRAKVEHPFLVKTLFRDRETRYRGLAKNAAQLFSAVRVGQSLLTRRGLLVLDTRGVAKGAKPRKVDRENNENEPHPDGEMNVLSISCAIATPHRICTR